MGRPRRIARKLSGGQAESDARRIDVLYGLEPVFEPAAAAAVGADASGVGIAPVDCPYCGESFESLIDTSAGSARYIEDCEVCCRPIEFVLDVDIDGSLQSLTALRVD